jgi:hypothetical protein
MSTDTNEREDHTEEADAAGGTMEGMTFTINTFRPEVEGQSTMEIDISSLTESQINALRREDPFLYYSIVKPTSNPNRSVATAVQGAVNQGRGNVVVVQRQRRISVEVDDVTAGCQFLEALAAEAEDADAAEDAGTEPSQAETNDDQRDEVTEVQQ